MFLMDIKTVLAIVISIGIMVVWQIFFIPDAPVIVKTTSDNITQVDNSQISTLTVTELGNTTSTTATPVEKIEEIVITNDKLILTFNSFTGGIRYASIKGWKDESAVAENSYVTFNKDGKSDYFNLLTPLNVKPSVEHTTVDGVDIVTFTSKENNLTIKKEYRIDPTTYMLSTSVTVINGGTGALNVPMVAKIGPRLGNDFEESNYIFEGAMIHNLEDTEKAKMDDDKTSMLPTPLWGGYTSKYFLFATTGSLFNTATISPVNGYEVVSLEKNDLVVNGNSTFSADYNIFIGPKIYKDLKSYNVGLQESIDFGWFYFLAIPMLQLLIFVAGIVKNYGLAIIVLTIIVRLIMLPLTIKQFKSMDGMKRIQPEIMKLREKFKGDPQRLNAETMELYKKHKVNPFSGCLPILVQIPIFFALYKTLLVSVELKGAPFIGYIVDLSAKDPYYITPVIMGISMFIQQWLTPSTADPVQKKIFMAMPVVFTFLFLNFPSGLVLYWLTSNILSIAQQLIITKRSAKRELS